MKAFLLLIGAAGLCAAGCTNVPSPAEATLVAGDQTARFLSPARIEDTEVAVFVGECWTRQLKALTDSQYSRDPDEVIAEVRAAVDRQQNELGRGFDLKAAVESERLKPVRWRLIAQALVLGDEARVPMHNIGQTAMRSFRTDSRYIRLRAEFPEDGDSAEAIIDLRKGRFVRIDRHGSSITIKQSRSAPHFM